MISNKTRAVLIALGLISSLPANAIDPAPILFDPISVIPQMVIDVQHNDNLFLDETSPQSSMIKLLKPSVQLLAERRNSAYRLTYNLEDARYANSSADDYTDHRLIAEAIFELSRHRVDVTGMYLKGHEQRGANNSKFGDKPSEYTDKSFGVVYRYGAEGAIANVELTGSYLDHSFDNFKALNESRDRENSRFGATFFYRLAPKTAAIFELRYEDIDYDLVVLGTPDLDSVETKYLVGVKWDATAKTSGTAKFGRMEKEYDSSRKDQGSMSWEVSAQWAPLTYSIFDVSATQEFEEATGTEDAIDSQVLSLSWGHDWNERFSTNVGLSRMEEEYSGISRTDETDGFTLSANYDIQRWLGIGLAYTNTDRASDVPGESYDNEQVMLTLSFSL